MRVSNVSLFNETIARADRAEKSLDLANKRIADLEIALKAAINDKRRLIEGATPSWRAPRYSLPDGIAKSAEINRLTTSETETLFAEVAEQVDAADLKSAGNHTVPVRFRPLARLQAMWRIWCA